MLSYAYPRSNLLLCVFFLDPTTIHPSMIYQKQACGIKYGGWTLCYRNKDKPSLYISIFSILSASFKQHLRIVFCMGFNNISVF